MLLVAVDTSGKQGSIALAQCGPDEACKVIETAPLSGGTFSAALVPEIAALLARHGFSKADIGALAVVVGPGSFTGLRIGLTVIKALAEALVKPIAAISLLEALSISIHSEGRVIAALDAGRSEVFLGEYEVNGGTAVLIREYLLAREKCLESAAKELIVTPDKVVGDAVRAKGLRVLEVERPRADAIARLGWKKIASGDTVSAELLEAGYIGQGDSEIFVKSNSLK